MNRGEERLGSVLAGRRKTVLAVGLASLFSAALLRIFYERWGTEIIADAYAGDSLSLFNRIVASQGDRPLEDFFEAANSLVNEVASVLVVIGVVLVGFALYSWLADSRSDLQEKNLGRFDGAIFVLGLFMSLAMVIVFDDVYHESDIETFFEWGESLSQSVQNIYILCLDCNYPIVGTALSAGLLNFLGSLFPGLDADSLTQVYRYVLAVIDGINVVLIYLILRKLNVARSLFWAGVVGLLPSSWVGGAVFGQIDNITQLLLLGFLLLQLAFLINDTEGATDRDGHALVYVVASSVLVAALLLTKQLALFSVPVLIFMVIACLYMTSKTRFISLSALFLGLTGVVVLLPDLFLNLQAGYFSHLQYILFGGGSDHLNIIAGNGFNVWVLLGRDIWSSSAEPFLGVLSPRNTGVALFLIYSLFSFGAVLWWLRRRYLNEHTLRSAQLLFSTFAYLLALTNLSFNVLVPGTRGRYLYHFIPFILIALLGLRQTRAHVPKPLLATVVASGVIYGRFVWGILNDDAVVIPHEVTAVIFLGLFLYLTVDFLRRLRVPETEKAKHATPV